MLDTAGGVCPLELSPVGQSDGRAHACREHFSRECAADSKKNEIKPWTEQSWIIPTATPEFVYHMEAVLDVYARPYDVNNPVVGLDESPRQLISELRTGFVSTDGVEHYDYEYRRQGVADL